MTMHGGRLILLLAGGDVQTAKQLASAATLSLAETTRQLDALITQGFVVAAGESGEPIVYGLKPKGAPSDALQPNERVLVIDDDMTLLELVVAVLEDEGHAVIAATTPANGVALLGQATFDVVITDGFSSRPSALLTTAAQILQAAEGTPVALFSAHRIDLDEVQAAGFRTLLQKPFELDDLIGLIECYRPQLV